MENAARRESIKEYDAYSADYSGIAAERNAWWVEALQGAAMTALGAAIVFYPGLTLSSLVFFVGTFIVALGVLEIINGIFSIRASDGWLMSMLMGVISVMLGVVVLRYPIASTLAYFYLVGFFLLVRGLFKFLLPIRRPALKALATLSGICSVLLGIVLLANPATGGLVFYWLSGLYALIAGPIQIALSMRARHDAYEPEDRRAAQREVAVQS